MLPPDAKRPDSVEGVNLLVIHPNSQWKTVFDLLVATCILYTAVVAPVQVCYYSLLSEHPLHADRHVTSLSPMLPRYHPCYLVTTSDRCATR